MSNSMDELEERARRMSDEMLVEAFANARLIPFASGFLGRRPPWSPDGNVSGPWQEYIVFKREIFRRMSSK